MRKVKLYKCFNLYNFATAFLKTREQYRVPAISRGSDPTMWKIALLDANGVYFNSPPRERQPSECFRSKLSGDGTSSRAVPQQMPTIFARFSFTLGGHKLTKNK